ncbi:hypothetical protein AT251_22055 [Enterovibrio nigricans]|nr:hypothetical protein AT251_22055 [Enterovibrio nigricans]
MVSIEIHGEIEKAIHCHCSMCRKAHGAQFASFGLVKSTSFVTSSKGEIGRYASSASVTRTLQTCGSNIQWIDHGSDYNKGWVSFSLGLLEGTVCLRLRS